MYAMKTQSETDNTNLTKMNVNEKIFQHKT